MEAKLSLEAFIMHVVHEQTVSFLVFSYPLRTKPLDKDNMDYFLSKESKETVFS